MVIIDQDGSGPGGSNQMAMMVLLQSPQAEVLGITMVSGDAWEPEEVQHTLRMLELIHRTDVPVVPGAIFPLVRTRGGVEDSAAALRRLLLVRGVGRCCGEDESCSRITAPYVVPKLREGEPTTKPLAGRCAAFSDSPGPRASA